MQAWPPDFLSNMSAMLGDDYSEFVKGLILPSPVSIRLNPFKQSQKFDNAVKVSWCENGRYLEQRPSFIFDPLFHAGCYYVQEASSMFLESVFKQYFSSNESLKAIDLCASPGGKSTHLISLLPEGSLLVSNEIIPQRNKVLRQNILKWGEPNVIVTQNEVADFKSLSGYFDLVLVDAPCSGEGLFRRDPDAAKEWSREAVQHCAYRQSGILENAFALLKPGGILIYCTCTFETSENEEQIEKLISTFDAELLELHDEYEGIINSGVGLRFYPAYIKGEGFFISAVRKKDGEEIEQNKTKKINASPAATEQLRKYIEIPEKFSVIEKDEVVFALPDVILPLFQFMEKKFYVRQAGIRLGELKGAVLQPAQELALSNYCSKNIPIYNFSLEDAIRYLRCESVLCPGASKGWTLAAHEGYSLGWMKVLDNRVNNYFPKEWRVLKEFNFKDQL